MAENEKHQRTERFSELPAGLLIRGRIISSIARVIPKKDRSGIFVRVSHEVATNPGIATWEEYIDPSQDPRVEVQSGEVKRFPTLEAFADVLLKVGRYRVFNGQLYVSNVEVIA